MADDAFVEWWNEDEGCPNEQPIPRMELARAAWDAAIGAAAQFMLSRNVSASEFYAAELWKMKARPTENDS